MGVGLTRLKHSDLDAMFIEVEVGNCYTLSEVSQKYNANPAVPHNLWTALGVVVLGAFMYHFG